MARGAKASGSSKEENMAEPKKSVFEVLNSINVNEHTEQRNGLTYLSWAWAWAEVKKRYPGATYTIYENADGLFYHTDGMTAWVKTGVTIEGLEHIEYLPVMDFKNKSIPLEKITSFDVNKAIQRSLTKALARHGMGLYIYAGEDLPEEEKKAKDEERKAQEEVAKQKIDEVKVNALREKMKADKVDEAALLTICKLEKLEDMTEAVFRNVIDHWDQVKK
jgi:hypothetical protein